MPCHPFVSFVYPSICMHLSMPFNHVSNFIPPSPLHRPFHFIFISSHLNAWHVNPPYQFVLDVTHTFNLPCHMFSNAYGICAAPWHQLKSASNIQGELTNNNKFNNNTIAWQSTKKRTKSKPTSATPPHQRHTHSNTSHTNHQHNNRQNTCLL